MARRLTRVRNALQSGHRREQHCSLVQRGDAQSRAAQNVERPSAHAACSASGNFPSERKQGLSCLLISLNAPVWRPRQISIVIAELPKAGAATLTLSPGLPWGFGALSYGCG